MVTLRAPTTTPWSRPPPPAPASEEESDAVSATPTATASPAPPGFIAHDARSDGVGHHGGRQLPDAGPETARSTGLHHLRGRRQVRPGAVLLLRHQRMRLLRPMLALLDLAARARRDRGLAEDDRRTWSTWWRCWSKRPVCCGTARLHSGQGTGKPMAEITAAGGNGGEARCTSSLLRGRRVDATRRPTWTTAWTLRSTRMGRGVERRAHRHGLHSRSALKIGGKAIGARDLDRSDRRCPAMSGHRRRPGDPSPTATGRRPQRSESGVTVRFSPMTA